MNISKKSWSVLLLSLLILVLSEIALQVTDTKGTMETASGGSKAANTCVTVLSFEQNEYVTKIASACDAGSLTIEIPKDGEPVLENTKEDACSRVKLNSYIERVKQIQVSGVANDQFDPSNEQAMKDYGFNDPCAVMGVSQSSGITTTIALGKQMPGEKRYYTYIEGYSAVFLMDEDTAQLLFETSDQFLRSALFKELDDFTVKSISIAKNNSEVVSFSVREDSTEKVAYYDMTAPYSIEVDHTLIQEELLEKLSTMVSTKIITNGAKDPLYGLQKPTYVITVQTEAEGYSVAFAQGKDGGWYAGRSDGDDVYVFSGDDISFLNKNTLDYFQNGIYSPNMMRLSSLTVEMNGESKTFTIASGEDNVTATCGGASIDRSTLLELYHGATDFIPSGVAEKPGGSPICTFTFHLLTGEKVSVLLYRSEDRSIYITASDVCFTVLASSAEENINKIIKIMAAVS